MNWLESVDLYCERTGPELWSEPLNALSNLAFIGVAALLWRRAGGRHSSADIRLLIALIAAVGLGSLVFHTVATRWAALLDIGFIALFVLVYHQRFQVRLLGKSAAASGRDVGAFVLLAVLFGAATRLLPPLALNGSEIYLPPFALLLVCARQAGGRAPQTARWLKLAGALFLVSITCRAIDQAICPIWPLGSHVGWHLVNAAMLYSCMRGLLADSAAPSAPAKHTVKSMI
ncbi:ceramidase domain-containing protein [Zoogloea sp.]|uniref:ceramidase domain-containing protein n=1 Tax=Zoogloea sp. TaxID=49181 RepID=UPI002613C1DD|nr:ceramidase domain-containing protein [Zoogloea sp.]